MHFSVDAEELPATSDTQTISSCYRETSIFAAYDGRAGALSDTCHAGTRREEAADDGEDTASYSRTIYTEYYSCVVMIEHGSLLWGSDDLSRASSTESRGGACYSGSKLHVESYVASSGTVQ